MYVCVCNAVTDSDIRTEVDNGVRTIKQLRRKTGCASTCGGCRGLAVEILQQALSDTRKSRVELPVMQMA